MRGATAGGTQAERNGNISEALDAYDRSAPYAQCFLGLERYWRKRRESRSPDLRGGISPAA